MTTGHGRSRNVRQRRLIEQSSDAAKGMGMEAISWRPADVAGACGEAQSSGKLVLVDFFSPT
jgi:hypothetical protein